MHEQALEFGGVPGIINENSIRSALARPYIGYHRFIHQKAAALLHGIVSNHGFTDGNKRTALYLVELLIQRSGYQFIEVTKDEFVDVITRVAQGDQYCSYDDLEEWFRTHVIRVDD